MIAIAEASSNIGATHYSMGPGDEVAKESCNCTVVVTQHSGHKPLTVDTITNSVFVNSCKEGSSPDSFSVTGTPGVNGNTFEEYSKEHTTAGEPSSDGIP